MEEKVIVTFSDIDNVEETTKAVFRLLESIMIRYEEKNHKSLEYFLLQITAYIGSTLQLLGIVDIDQLKDQKDIENLPDLEEGEDL
jgi:hypothetical protein